MNSEMLGKLLLVVAVVLALAGGVLWAAGRLGIGTLPGDLHFERSGVSCYVPIASSIIISIILTILANLLWRFWR